MSQDITIPEKEEKITNLVSLEIKGTLDCDILKDLELKLSELKFLRKDPLYLQAVEALAHRYKFAIDVTNAELILKQNETKLLLLKTIRETAAASESVPPELMMAVLTDSFVKIDEEVQEVSSKNNKEINFNINLPTSNTMLAAEND